MESKQRLQKALNHQEPDRLPIDFGATNSSGMHVTCVAALRDYFGLEKRPVKVHEPYSLAGLIEEDLQKAMGIDITMVNPPKTMFGFTNENWKEWEMDNGLTVLVADKFNTTKDDDGNTYIYPEGDLNTRPSGKLPKNGYYFDSLIRQEAFDEDNLNPEDNLEEYSPMSEATLEYFQRETEKAASTGLGVVANFGGMGLGDIALVPAPFLKNPKGIRDIEEWYVSTAARQDYIHAIFEKQTEIAIENLKKLNARVGHLVDVAFICGTDFGTQIGTFCSSQTYVDLYHPYYKKLNDWIHSNTSWKTMKHSCGAIESFMPLLINSGFDIINPVQCSASGMEPENLKEKYGKDIVFWGAGVDTQRILPFGTPGEVREQVLRRCEIFSKDGGFVFNSIHNVQAKTPVENIIAMLDAVNEFNGK